MRNKTDRFEYIKNSKLLYREEKSNKIKIKRGIVLRAVFACQVATSISQTQAVYTLVQIYQGNI